MFDAGIAFYTHRSQPAIEPCNFATLRWQPNRNPVEFVTIKWRQRMAGRTLHLLAVLLERLTWSLRSLFAEAVEYTSRKNHGSRGPPRNHTMQQWCGKVHKTTGRVNTGSVARYAL